MSIGLIKALRGARLSLAARSVAVDYASYCSEVRGDRTCQIPAKQIAKNLAVNRKTVMRALAELQGAGIVKLTRRGRRNPFITTFTDPATWPRSPLEQPLSRPTEQPLSRPAEQPLAAPDGTTQLSPPWDHSVVPTMGPPTTQEELQEELQGEPLHPARNVTSAGANLVSQPPHGVLPETWQAWRGHRKGKLTAFAVRLQAKRLAEWAAQGHDPNRIVEDAIANGWTGLYPPRGPPKRNQRAQTLAEQRAANLDKVTQQGGDNRGNHDDDDKDDDKDDDNAINGTAERVDS
jgi:DNA-binding transcriptional ArsR family regulator